MDIVVTVDGTDHPIDLAAVTLQESCDIEDALGPEAFERYQQGNVSPKVIRAIVWAKLRRTIPDVTLEDFDLDLNEAFAAAGDDDPGPFDVQS